jgi:DNA-binding NtrC family response regulator
VNDYPCFVKTVCPMLGDMGIQARGFTNPGEFLSVAEQEGCDIALVNYLMPELNGIRVIERLRKMDARTFIILETTSPMLHVLVEGLRAGADEMLPVPFKPEELEATVRRAHHHWMARGRSGAPPLATAGAPAGAEGPAEPGKTRRDQVVIYAVDDDPDLLKVLRLILEDRGYTSFRDFPEPEAIVEAATDEPCHIALANVTMLGDKLGIGIIRALREISPWMHIILETGVPDVDTMIEAAKAGANDLLFLPFKAEEFSEAIQRGCLRLGITPADPPPED